MNSCKDKKNHCDKDAYCKIYSSNWLFGYPFKVTEGIWCRISILESLFVMMSINNLNFFCKPQKWFYSRIIFNSQLEKNLCHEFLDESKSSPEFFNHVSAFRQCLGIMSLHTVVTDSLSSTFYWVLFVITIRIEISK